jgi:enoyl-CoA hydratase/carnithine racemase
VKPYPDMPPGLSLARDGEVLKLSFNRPARRNSLTDPIVYALTDTMDAAASDESVRVIHLQGEARALTWLREHQARTARGWALSTDE